MSEWIKLCHSSDLDRTGAKSLAIEIDNVFTDIFIVRNDSEFYAYVDNCPHLGSPLSWKDDEFLDKEGEFIQCATHDARFSIKNGRCVSGPCVDKSLTSFAIEVINDEIFFKR